MKKILIISIVIITLGLSIGFLQFSTKAEKQNECPKIEIPEPVCNVECPEQPAPICNLKCPECPEEPLFVKEAMIVAHAHDYERWKYNCYDFSKELFKRLKADGYEVYFCTGVALWCVREGKAENECYHHWVKLGEGIYIEATTGEFIPPKDYDKNYKEIRCSRYVDE